MGVSGPLKPARASQARSLLDQIPHWSPSWRTSANIAVTVLSLLLCATVMPMRFPGIDLLGVGPNWVLIWVVSWSMFHGVWPSLVAGLAAGAIMDGLTAPEPTHMVPLALVAVLTAQLRRRRLIEDEFGMLMLLVFALVAIAETVFAVQFILQGQRDPADVWALHQWLTLCSAILTSLWAPVVYVPLRLWWQRIAQGERSP